MRTTKREISPTLPRRYSKRPKIENDENPGGRHQTPIKVPRTSNSGRPQIYDAARFPHIAKTLCKEYGFTSVQLAKVFGVSKLTIDDWLRKYAEFKEAVREGRDNFDTFKVENALLKRALGYEYVEVTETSVRVRGKDAEGNKVTIPATRKSTVTKMIPPDVKACLFWLTNRQDDRWKMVTNVNAKVNGQVVHSGTVVHAHADLTKLSKDDLLTLRNMVERQQEGVIPADFERIDEQVDADVLQLDHILQNIDTYDLMGDEPKDDSWDFDLMSGEEEETI